MGTNYYFKPNATEDQIHIGKASDGWVFALHVIPSKGINDLPDWLNLFPTGTIHDDHRQPVTTEAMIDIITKREGNTNKVVELMRTNKDPRTHAVADEEFLRLHNAEPGPNNLVRHRENRGDPDRDYIRHGTGTWDRILGIFF